MIKILLLLVVLTGNVQSYTVKAVNGAIYKVAIDFLDIAGNSHATMILDPQKKRDDERDIGDWCTEKIRVTIIKPNGGYGGIVEVKTPGDSCDSFKVGVKINGMDVPYYIQNSSWLFVEVRNPNPNKRFAESEYASEHYSLPHLLNVTTQSSIIANNTNAGIKLLNAPSLGTGAKDGVPVNPGATIPFYLNAGSAGEELVIKGNGVGKVSFGNDYAKHKTTLIRSTNINGVKVIGWDGKATNKSLNAQSQLVIDPLERLDITTPNADWEIKLKVAEPLSQ